MRTDSHFIVALYIVGILTILPEVDDVVTVQVSTEVSMDLVPPHPVEEGHHLVLLDVSPGYQSLPRPSYSGLAHVHVSSLGLEKRMVSHILQLDVI